MRILGLIGCCGCLLAAGIAGAGDADRLAELDRLLASGRAEEAARTAAELLATEVLEPRNVWRIQQRLAVGLVRSGRAEEAVPVLEEALAVAPQDPALHLNLGRALRSVGHGGRAVAEYGLAVSLQPDRFDWHLEYAEALLDLNIRRDALEQIRRARELCRDCPEALRGEVNFRLEDGDLAAAVEPLRALQSVAPTSATRALLVQTLWNLDDAEGVVAVLDTVPEADLGAEELTLLLEADRRLGDPERALRWVESDAAAVRRLQRPEHQAWALLAEMCLAGDEPDAALVAIDRAIALEPRTAAYHQNRAAILVALGREDAARDALERARSLDPRLGRAP